MQQAPTAAPQATDIPSDREKWVVWIAAAAVFMSVLNTTMVNVALPTIGGVFDAGPARVAWLATLYSLFFGVATPFYGRLGDRYGLRRMYVSGLAIFVASSLMAGLAPEFWMLVLCRIGQAIGSAAIPSLGTAMITRTIPAYRRGAALGLISASVGAGQAFGPTIGGLLTDFASWRLLFLVSSGLVFVIPLALKRLPGDSEHNLAPVDWLGGFALAVAIAGLLFGIGNLEEQGLASTAVLGSFGVSAIAAVATVIRQRSVRFPFIERALLANPRFLLLCGIGFLSMGGSIGAIILAPFLFERVNGLATSSVGLALLPQAAVLTLLSRRMGRLADRFDSLLLISIGLTISMVVIGFMVTVAVGWPTLALIVLFSILGAGQAMVNSPLSLAVTRSIPGRSVGAGLGIYNMLFFVGGGFGAAIATTLLASRETAAGALLPLYQGDAGFSEFGDAYIYSLVAFALGLLLAQLARRTSAPSETE